MNYKIYLILIILISNKSIFTAAVSDERNSISREKEKYNEQLNHLSKFVEGDWTQLFRVDWKVLREISSEMIKSYAKQCSLSKLKKFISRNPTRSDFLFTYLSFCQLLNEQVKETPEYVTWNEARKDNDARKDEVFLNIIANEATKVIDEEFKLNLLFFAIVKNAFMQELKERELEEFEKEYGKFPLTPCQIL